MRILFVAAEAEPLAKVGGLADVIGALPGRLAARGHDVRVALPHYGLIDEHALQAPTVLCERLDDPILDRLGVSVRVSRTELSGVVPAYLIGTDRWFGDSMRSEAMYVGDPSAYVAFGRASALVARGAADGWTPDIVHCHDWHAGLTNAYVRNDCAGARPGLVFTVHNLAYSGTFEREVMDLTGLPRDLYTYDGLEYYGGFSFLKAGMVYSDMVNTVSETYAREVAEPEHGGGLAGLVEHLTRSGRFRGIVNGIDAVVWDPASDRTLAATYHADDRSGKRLCKASLREDVGLERDASSPVIGMVSRICDQKGHDLVAQAADGLVEIGAQLVVLGVGDAAMTEALKAAERRHPGRIAVRVGYDAYLATRIYAGSDMFLMPSRFEPCGLGQLIALRYGAAPVVRRTGGLADTVRDVDSDPRRGNGFVFDDATPEAITAAVGRASDMYRDRRRWGRLVVRGMREDHDWHHVAPAYERLYDEALRSRAGS